MRFNLSKAPSEADKCFTTPSFNPSYPLQPARNVSEGSTQGMSLEPRSRLWWWCVFISLCVCVCVWGSPPCLPGCAFRLLMLCNLVKIAWGILAYSWSSKPPSCFRGKPCGKHALNLTRCCMYNVAYRVSYRELNNITLIWCTSKHGDWVI